jgi:curved DNA-binding protein CbpA
MAETPTYYDVLEITPAATPDQIRHAYLAMARKFHPDFYAQQTPEVRAQAEQRMQLVNQAAHVLGDINQRRRYDDDLRRSGRLASAGAVPAATGSRRSRAARASTASSAPAAGARTRLGPTLLLVASVLLLAAGAAVDLPAVMLGGMVAAVVAAVATLRAGTST